MNKKGLFFTLTALALVSLTILIAFSPTATDLQSEQLVYSYRVQSMNSFIDNIIGDAEVALFASGFRALLAVVQEVSTTGSYADDPQELMEELILNGSLEGVEQLLLVNNTLVNWTDNIEAQAQLIGIDLAINYTDIDIDHSSPWFVDVSVTFVVNMSDQRELASWNFSFTRTAQIQIEGFDDPMYVIETGNQFNQIINKTPYSQFTSGSDTTNLTDHIESGYYIAFNQSPSYLMRLAGNFSASPYGIESLVDKDELGLIIPVDTERSNVDSIYFSSQSPAIYSFNSMSPTFRLDNASDGEIGRIQLYNLTNLTQ